VSPYLEITEITDRVSKQHGPALLFENVTGCDIPVLTNAFGSFVRTCMALGVNDLNELGNRIPDFLQMGVPDSLIKKLKLLPRLKRIGNIFPKMVKSAPCQEVVLKGDEADLGKFPVLHCWPLDGGAFITLPLVFTRHPVTRVRNVGCTGCRYTTKKPRACTGISIRGGAQHYRVAEELGRRLPVAVAIGPDPVMTYAATAPLPEDMDEALFAGFLRGEAVELVRCLTIDHEVPANSQIVLEGYVEPCERRREGPFGDHTGYYSLPDDYPVFHITCITHRNDLIYPATVVGRPPQEDCYLAKATERLFLPLIKKQFPEIVDMNLPFEGVFHNLAFISIDKRYPGHAKKIMQAVWGLGQMSFTKIVAVFDRDVNVQDVSEVIWRLGNNIDPKRDITFVEGPVDVLDHASPLPSLGTKMGIDATRKWKGEGFEREWPPVIEMTSIVKDKIDNLWEKLGLKK
jgi:menaquinone biosynthesis decarboxylase, SCO4490 family